MASQTYVKRGKGYEAKLVLTSEADVVSSQYEVYVDIAHEWGSALMPSARLAATASPGDTEVTLTTTSGLSVGSFVIFGSGAAEHRKLTAVDTDTNIVSFTGGLEYKHPVNSSLLKMTRATRDSALHYSYDFSAGDLDSCGRYHIRWVYIVSGEATNVDQFIEVYQPYTSSGEFFDLYPEYETAWDDKFDDTERIIRNIINTYCGQNFNFYSNKTQLFDGEDSKTLNTGMRIENLIQVIMYPNSDITGSVVVDKKVREYVKVKPSDEIVRDSTVNVAMQVDAISKFSSNREYEITADWGWYHVPGPITQAAVLLLAEYMSDDSTFRKRHIKSMIMDSEAVTFDGKNQSGSTGNIDVDVLLLDFTKFIIGMV